MAYNWNALRIQKCLFNGLDHLAELLWRRNPCRSKTVSSQLNVFDIPLFQQWLRLRPPYPKSWIWTMDEAALCLQRYIRGWIVRKRVDVQELRQFWKVAHVSVEIFLIHYSYNFLLYCIMLHVPIPYYNLNDRFTRTVENTRILLRKMHSIHELVAALYNDNDDNINNNNNNNNKNNKKELLF
ncbi:IQ domain-containing protein K [Dufourea novaeangliae]|uniref:IQ domain-containing protein K n=1 Tax=Dufourea novaeangliae TaxID=178035 RepID=A0A154PPE5_DUFNO|nr:IQ domain-containing protein K [Dufourea novaeangliae]